ncbi:MAG: response regulator transcription factor [Dehalococcoidales bacterium]|nr:response regulator transcription factor [Dehalococcoidales bacterium]
MSDIRVLLVDDYEVVLLGLRRMLELDGRIKVVGEASNGEEAIAKAATLQPDIITMDLKMPGMDGITATRQLKQEMPNVHVLAMTMYGDELIQEAIDAGVSGYILKETDCDQIIQAIHQTYDGLHPMIPPLNLRLPAEFIPISS